LVSHSKEITVIGAFGKKCCGKYMDLTKRKEQDYGENYTIRSFIICTFITREMKSRRIRWARHVTRMGKLHFFSQL
jgi:hypothetical protein